MSAKASGADARQSASASAQNRSHNDGSAGRAFTVEQKDAVIRVRKCDPTAFYEILGLQDEKSSVTDAGIKKAYRKLSLLTHPDKNGYAGADEAFKMVSRAFQILSDVDKKKKYDTFGGDPDTRFSSASASASSPFSAFSSTPRARSGRTNMWEEEMSPEDLFRQFFGGGLGAGFGGGGPFGGGGGGGLFNNGPSFVFNMGGGPGMRVHQFGGNQPRRRPAGTADDPAPTASTALTSLLPLLLLFFIPIFSSLFSSGSFFSSSSNLPSFSLERPHPPYTQLHTSATHRIDYFVNPVDVTSFTSTRDWKSLDNRVERTLLQRLDNECTRDDMRQQRLLQDAQGFFWIDHDKVNEARNMEMPACDRLRNLGFRR